MFKTCILFCLLFYFNSVISVKRPIFDFDSTDFTKIVKTTAFVDKTLFIKHIININRTSLITAPPGFGKSTNLNMLKKFLELQVDESGDPLTKTNINSYPVTDTENYKLFEENRLKITEEYQIMKDHFGKTPVISLTFKCEVEIKTLDDAVNFFKLIIHKAYRDHKYLLESSKLGEDHKQLIDNWCNEKTFDMFGKHRVQTSLRELSEYLYRHFQKKAVILIDDHDSVTKSAMTHIPGNDDLFDDVARFSVFIINALVKNNKHISFGVICGVIDLPLFGSLTYNPDDPESYIKFKFLDDHELVNFFGLTEEEVEELIVYPKLKLGEHVEGALSDRYSGYQSKNGKSVYNLYSVLKFLEAGEFKNFWANDNGIPQLKDILKLPIVEKFIKKLLKDATINVGIHDQLKVDNLIDLRKLLTYPQEQPAFRVTGELFSFLMDYGFLTYVKSPKTEDEKWPVKIPNTEIMEYLTEVFNGAPSENFVPM